MSEQCACWAEVSELTEDWEPIKVWLYSFGAGEYAPAELQVRDGRNEILTSIQVHYCPKCGRYLG